MCIRDSYIDGSFDFGASYPNDSIGFKSGDNVQLVSEWDPLNSSYALKISATDTTYENATDITSGLMSSADKAKLNGIETGAEKNVVKSVSGKTGVVVLDKSDVGLGNLTNDKQAKETDFNAHDGDNVRHITAAERTGWNGKVSQTELSNGLALKADKADFDAHDADEERHITPQERARWDASAIVGDASGEKIVLDDIAPQGAIRELEIYGKSEQETSTQGKNLLDTTGIGVGSNFDNYVNDVTFTHQSDGGVKVTGTTMNEYSPYSTRFELIDKMTVGKTYTKSMTGGVTGINFAVVVIKNDDTSTRPTTFTLDDTVKSVKAYLEITKIDAPIDTTVYLQVEEGSVATAYEPFVPNKPSPEYPSEIKSAENFTALFLRGKNLLDMTGCDKTQNGITYTYQSDGSVKVSGTSTGYGASRLINITNRLTRGKYYRKASKGLVNGLSFVISVTDSNGAVKYPSDAFLFDDNVVSVNAYLQILNAGVTVDTAAYLHVEENTGVTPTYEPYGGTVVNIPYELRGIPNTTGGWLARDYIEVKDGAVKLVRECAEKVFDGTEMWGRTTDAHTPADVNNFYTNSLDGGAAIKWACNPMSDRLISCPYGTVPEANMFIWVPNGGNARFRILVKNGYLGIAASDTADQAKAKLVSWLTDNNLTVVYQLATPTVEDITETETGQALLALTLTAPDAALSNTAESGMAVRYEVDGTIAYKKQESRLSARIAALEAAIINHI